MTIRVGDGIAEVAVAVDAVADVDRKAVMVVAA